MKAPRVTLALPDSIALLQQQWRAEPAARLIAGGQSLGPMLALRLVRPPALIAIDRLAPLRGVAAKPDHVCIGAAVTHAEIEDARLPDIGQQVLPRIAAGIAYRAVRSRGTIGGSLCHADPAADWPTTLLALDAAVLSIDAAGGGRQIRLSAFFTGAFATALAPGELLQAVRIPRLSAAARWVYRKACRKPGAFAHAMVALLVDPGRDLRRLVIGAVGGPPLLFEGAEVNPDAVAARLGSAGLDPIRQQQQLVMLSRELAEAAL